MINTLLLPGVALLVSLVAALSDARTGRIPNWLTFSAAVTGLGFHALLNGWAGLLASASGLLLSATVPWLLHRSTRGKAIGGGDVKLFGALGALVGPIAGLEIELSACVLLTSFALLRLAFQGKLCAVLANALRLLANPILPQKWRCRVRSETLTEMRMGPAIALAVVSVVLRDHLLRWLPWIG